MNWYKKAQYYQEREIERLSRNNPYPFKEWFDEKGRAYIPFFSKNEKTQKGIDQYIKAELEENGYQITDYRKGLCSSGNRELRIGKVLNSLHKKRITELQNQLQNTNQEQDQIKYKIMFNQIQQEIENANKYYQELKDTFINSTYRSHQSSQKDAEFYVVISQNPHDVAQMSTNRQWTSCMDLGGDKRQPGSHYEDVFCEVKNGRLVAYLIRADDTEIENPLARVHIRRFDNREGQSIAVPEQTVYGNEIKGFQESIKLWLQQKQGDINPGAYERQGGEYSDTFGSKMLISPSNIEDILKWLRGEGKDAQYSTWSVNDHLFLEYDDSYSENYGGDYYDYQSPVSDESQTFKTKEEAEQYLLQKNKEDNQYGEYDREEISSQNPEWLNKDEETGEWEEQRFWLQENKTDNRQTMTNEAIETILKSPKGIYPIEVIKEIKNILFNESIIHSPRKDMFLETYPELLSNEEIQKMKDSDQLKIFKKLSPERQEQQRLEWTNYINDTLDNPQVFENEKVQERMRERDRTTDINTKVRANESVGLHYTNTLNNWLFDPLKEIFKPIPEPIIQKLVNFGMNFMEKDKSIAPYKDLPKYDEWILANIIHVFFMTDSDTPTVQNFYKKMLPLWKDNRETYYDNFSAITIDSLGSAIGRLGENGRDFLPFINNKIQEEKIALTKLEKSFFPQEREWQKTKDLLSRAYKKIEKLYYIKKEIDPSFQDKQDYRWSKTKMNWFKKAQINGGKVKFKPNGSFFILGKNVKPGEGPWRVTYFNEYGRGMRHSHYPTYEDAKRVFDNIRGLETAPKELKYELV